MIEIKTSHVIVLGQALVCLILASMTKYFALANLFEISLALVFCFSAELRARFVEVLMDPRIFLTLGFWCWVAIATIWGEAPLLERLGDWWSWRKLLLVPMCFVLFTSDQSKKFLSLGLIAILTGYMLTSWLIFWGIFDSSVNAAQLIENHATQGVLFSGAAALSYFLFKSATSLVARIVLAGLIIGFVSNVIWVGTGRSGYLFLIVVSAYAGYVSVARNRLLVGALIGLLVIGGLSTSSTSMGRIQLAVDRALNAFEPQTTSYSSLGIRIIFWTNTIEMVKRAPLLGTGSGSFKYGYEKIISDETGWRGTKTDDPHQQYLHIAAEYGLLGLAVFLLALLAWIKTQISQKNPYQLTAIAVLLGTAANGLANGHFSAFVEGRFLWIILAAFLSASPPPCVKTGCMTLKAMMGKPKTT